VSIARFSVNHPVPVNLLMMGTLAGGIAASMMLTKEFFPEITPRSVQITLPYPGASPEEVEEGLAIKVEDAIADIDEVERITTTLSEGGGGIFAEFRSDVRDVRKAVDEVERAVDALTDLPEDAEEIQVAEFEPRLPVIMVSLHGDADEEAMKRAIRAVRDDLRTLPGMGEILFSGVRDYEIRVDVSAAALLEHGISLPQVSRAVEGWMADIPGGVVRTGAEDVRVRTTGVPERGEAIRQIVVAATPDGGAVRVADIAEVREHYVDEQLITRFGRFEGAAGAHDARPAVSLTVFKTGAQDAVMIAEMVRAYVQGRRGEDFPLRWRDRVLGAVNAAMGPGTGEGELRTARRRAWDLGRSAAAPLPGDLSTHSDLARFIEGRLDLLLRNAMSGGILLFLTLLVFLNWRASFWVASGLVTAICGTLMIMIALGITLNLLTMFGLIVVLGMLVDDGIVVAENIQARHDRGEPALAAAVNGTNEVLWPVVATVLTTIVAFVPLSFIKGQIGDLLEALPMVVACALSFSLIEALLIMPSHMGHSLARRDRARPGRWSGALRRFETWRDVIVLERVLRRFERLLGVLIRWRYATAGAFLAALVLSLGLVAGGRLEFTFLPTADSETIIVDLRMPVGTPIERTDAIVRRIEAAAAAQPETQSAGTVIGYMADLERGVTAGLGGHLAQVYIELKPVEARDRESAQVIDAIRQALGPVSDVERLRFSEIQGGPGGADITIIAAGNDPEEAEEVVGEIKGMLAEFEGVRDIADDSSLGQREVHVRLRPGAAGLDLTVAEVAAQVRGALYGLEPHVFAAEREDIKVRLRLDERSRRSLHAIESMYVVAPGGRAVPLAEVAEVAEGTAWSTIHRVDRRRAVTVLADTAPGTNPELVTAAMEPALRALEAAHPGMRIELAGRQREMARAFDSLPLGFLAACLMIYINLAWLFASFWQPVAVMLAIPFSIIGVVWGHYLMGYQLTFLSLIGFVALSGVVVNDSLILIDFYNARRRAGLGVRAAILSATPHRLRAILLTTLTTVLSMTPLMLEQSFQAKFMIPMAISISFGLMSATLLVLIALPCILVILDDIGGAAHWLWFGRPRP
jgi:multidrug efflux pump subunit AcrB